ncbi:MAG: hypothetical protein D6775_06210, partial [Caldilineae bacterium]
PTPRATPGGGLFSRNPGIEGLSQRVNFNVFLLALLANLLAAAAHYLSSRAAYKPRHLLLQDVLTSIIGGQLAYLLYALGWLPGSPYLEQQLGPLTIPLVTFAGGLLPLLINLFRRELRPTPPSP